VKGNDTMNIRITIAVGLITAVAGAALAQAPPAPPKTLAATIDVYVFPTEGQTPEQQSTDEAACYNWAVQNTGTDPFQLQKQAEQAQQQSQQAQQEIAAAGQGAGVTGGVWGGGGGAAAGALIGEIASDDAGKGAAYGAAAGAVVARRRTKRAKADASQQVEQQSQQAQQATAEQIENFKKAFSVCLEGKKYLVKF
jgi:hypothetical protein